jgi:hypothetical protein
VISVDSYLCTSFKIFKAGSCNQPYATLLTDNGAGFVAYKLMLFSLLVNNEKGLENIYVMIHVTKCCD